MRKVDFVQTVIEVTDGFALCRSSEKWNEAREGSIEFRDGAFNAVEQRAHRCDHDKAVPQAAAQLQHLREHLVRVFPEAAHADYFALTMDRLLRFDPTVFDLGAFRLQTEEHDEVRRSRAESRAVRICAMNFALSEM